MASGGNRVFVGNLPWSVDWRMLKDHFSEIGEVSYANVMMRDNRSKGCGIVEFLEEEDALRAIEELNDTEFEGRSIFVREDREAGGSPRARNETPMVDPECRVFVGNLPWSVDWRDLKDHFKSCGDVAFAKVMTMQDGRSKGCGIVEFTNPEDAQHAIDELNETDMDGRPILVRFDRQGR